MLEIRLFGEVSLYRDGERIARPSGQPASRVLAWTALNGRASRETIASELWPESTPTAAKNSLRVALAKLKESMPDEVWEEYFTTDAGATGLRRELGIRVDLEEARVAATRSQPAGEASGPRGPLLPGLEGEWETGVREEWERVSGPASSPRVQHSHHRLGRRLPRAPGAVVAAVLALIAVAVAVGVVAARNGSRGERSACSPGLARPDPADGQAASGPASQLLSRTATIEVGLRPAAVAAGREGVWVAERQGIALIDPRQTRKAAPIIPVAEGSPTPERAPFAIALARDRMWITRRDGTLVSIDRSSRERTGRPVRYGKGAASVAIGGGAIWVNNFEDAYEGSLTRIDPCTGSVRRIRVGRGANSVYAAYGSLWATNAVDGSLEKIDPVRQRKVASITGLQDPQDVVAARGLLWVVQYGEQSLQAVDPRTNRLLGRPIRIGPDPGGVVESGDFLWIPLYGNGTLTRVDLKARRSRLGFAKTGQSPTDVAVGYGRLWFPNNDGDTVTAIGP